MEDPNEFIRVGVSLRRNGSLVCPHPSLLIDGISKSFSYNKLPQEPLNLTVMKLDGSSFDIEVPKMGTFAQLKQGVEAAFSHLPIEEPGMMVSWPHVWGNFCLSYKGQKLLNDSDHIIRYGIKDGDKLHFIRHVSVNMMEKLEEDYAISETSMFVSESRVRCLSDADYAMDTSKKKYTHKIQVRSTY